MQEKPRTLILLLYNDREERHVKKDSGPPVVFHLRCFNP